MSVQIPRGMSWRVAYALRLEDPECDEADEKSETEIGDISS